MAVEKTTVETVEDTTTEEERAAASATIAAEAAAAATALAAGNAAAANMDAAERLRKLEEENTSWRTATETRMAELAATNSTLASELSSLAQRLSTPPSKAESETPVPVTVVETPEKPPAENEAAPPEAKPKRKFRLL